MRLVVQVFNACSASFCVFILVGSGWVLSRGWNPAGEWLGDLPRFVLCDDCLVGCADAVSKSESQIVAKVSV